MKGKWLMKLLPLLFVSFDATGQGLSATTAEASRETRRMTNKLSLTDEQKIVVGVINDRLWQELEKTRLTNNDSVFSLLQANLISQWKRRLEEVLSETQFEAWMEYVDKYEKRKAAKKK